MQIKLEIGKLKCSQYWICIEKKLTAIKEKNRGNHSAA